MNLETFKNRLRKKGVNLATNGAKMAEQILRGHSVFTCKLTGTGSIRKNLDYTADVKTALKAAGLKSVDFTLKNNAPRSGKTGQYIELTKKGSTKKIK